MTSRTILRIVLAAGLAGLVAWAAVNREMLDPAALEGFLASAGPWAPIIFALLFAAATVAFVPGMVFSLAGGALFGPVLGVAINLSGATLGAVLAFLAARYLAADLVRTRSGPRLQKVIEGVEAESWRFVAFVRLVPLFPFNFVNYAFGLTRIRLRDYTLATAVCMAPGAAAYTYLGYAGKEAITGGEAIIQKGLLALAALALIAFLPRLVKRLRATPVSWIEVSELKKRLDRNAEDIVVDVRGAAEFGGDLGHIPGALNISVDELPKRVGELAAAKGKPITMVCKTDKRSAMAAGILRDREFSDVRVLKGGMEAWTQQGFPVDRASGSGQWIGPVDR